MKNAKAQKFPKTDQNPKIQKKIPEFNKLSKPKKTQQRTTEKTI